ncbi:MAG TPA: hypothetical protein VNZ47_00805 [Candidatus Dormibacteraeota bacterium]|nr:hypothetical protein [Candidatus Dormibacteraeota bacterium]
MRKLSTLVCFCCLLALGGTALSQSKVAEGEYQMLAKSGSPGKISSRWVLYGKSDGGYHLSSEIQNVPGGMRVIQLEDLDSQLVPVTIAFELYPKNETQPAVRLACAVVKTSVSCRGDDSAKGAAPVSSAYDVQGPFIFWLRDLAFFDIGWQMSGGLNMMHSMPAKTAALKTLLVTGGSALILTDKLNIAAVEAVKGPNQTVTAITPEKYTEWEFESDEETSLVTLGKEEIRIDGKKITATHYSVKNRDEGPTDFWMAAGLLVKMTDRESAEFVLNNYRQYKTLIPEFKVEENSKTQSQGKK